MLSARPAPGMIRCAQSGDIHAGALNFGPLDPATGLRGRAMDTLACLDRAIDIAVERGAHAFIWPGDLSRDPRPEPTVMREIIKRAQRIADAGMALVVTPGNHDIPAAEGKASAVTVLGYLRASGVHVFENIGLSRIETSAGALQILHIPWILPQHVLAAEEAAGLTPEALAERMRATVRASVGAALAQADSAVPVVAVAHGTVPGASLGSERRMWQGREWDLPEGLFDDERVRYVALGHLHGFQQVGFRPPAIYSGSPDRMDFSEEQHDKGFVIFDVPERGDATFEFVPLPARTYRTIRTNVVTSETPMTTLLADIAKTDVRGAVTRVEVTCRPDQLPQIREEDVRKALTGAYAVAGIAKRPASDDAAGGEVTGIGVESDPLRALEAYLEERGTDRTTRDDIIALFNELAARRQDGSAARREAA